MRAGCWRRERSTRFRTIQGSSRGIWEGKGQQVACGWRQETRMLNVTKLNQYYGGSHILRDLEFEVPAGKVTALLGRNGVGKTTLLKTLMGVVPARSGRIVFADTD